MGITKKKFGRLRKKHRAPTRRTPEYVQHQERTKRALQLRMEGKAYRDIAVELGYPSQSSCYQACRDMLMQTATEAGDEVRALELERLDKLLSAMQPLAQAGDPEAVRTVLGISKRRASMLGLDAPVRTEHTFNPADKLTETELLAMLNGKLEETPK